MTAELHALACQMQHLIDRIQMSDDNARIKEMARELSRSLAEFAD